MLAFNDWWATSRQAHLLPNPLGAWDFQTPLNPGEIPVRPTSTRARDLAVTLCAPPLTANRGPLPSHAASRSWGTEALTCGTLGAAEAWTGHCSSPTSRSDSLLPTRAAKTPRAPRPTESLSTEAENTARCRRFRWGCWDRSGSSHVRTRLAGGIKPMQCPLLHRHRIR
jgi:hypothetical protein